MSSDRSCKNVRILNQYEIKILSLSLSFFLAVLEGADYKKKRGVYCFILESPYILRCRDSTSIINDGQSPIAQQVLCVGKICQHFINILALSHTHTSTAVLSCITKRLRCLELLQDRLAWWVTFLEIV